MENKNLIYFICDNSYIEILNFNIDTFLNNINQDIDICVICPNNFQLNSRYESKNIYLFKQDEYDYRHTSKFNICNWPFINNYTNILYIDVDAIIVKNPNNIFKCIDSNHNIIHSVKEVDSINDRINDGFFRFTSQIFKNNPIGYNCGTFGFNIKMLDTINDLLNFCINNKINALCDQPMYNEFLINLNLINNTLSDFVYLNGNKDYYDNINKINIDNAIIIHFLGNAYASKNINVIKSIINI